MTDDAVAEPLWLLLRDRPRTTVGEKDGGSRPMEDWTYDFVADDAP